MQRYFGKIKNDNKIQIEDNDWYHIITVMRMKDNELVEVVFDKNIYICSLDLTKKELLIVNEKESLINNLPYITLYVPILKESKMDYIFQKATELGVNEIIIITTQRTIIKLDDKKLDNRINRWLKICKEASEQSKRIDIPLIKGIEKLNKLKEPIGLSMFGSTVKKENNIRNFLQKNKNCDKINVIIGPEGGFSKQEESFLESIKFVPVSFGTKILRSETAPLFILSVINYEYME